MHKFRRHLTISALFLISEAWLGIGILGMGIGTVGSFVALVAAIKHKERRFFLLGVAAVYVTLCVATTGVILSNWRLARQRAEPVISAINRFHSDQGRYPETLDELVPSYLPSIPRAGFTLVGRHFGYITSRPQLYFPAMFHGIVAYDFPSGDWRTNE